jgi:hypothetical protein
MDMLPLPCHFLLKFLYQASTVSGNVYVRYVYRFCIFIDWILNSSDSVVMFFFVFVFFITPISHANYILFLVALCKVLHLSVFLWNQLIKWKGSW